MSWLGKKCHWERPGSLLNILLLCHQSHWNAEVCIHLPHRMWAHSFLYPQHFKALLRGMDLRSVWRPYQQRIRRYERPVWNQKVDYSTLESGVTWAQNTYANMFPNRNIILITVFVTFSYLYLYIFSKFTLFQNILCILSITSFCLFPFFGTGVSNCLTFKRLWFCFYFMVTPRGIRDLSSPTRNHT